MLLRACLIEIIVFFILYKQITSDSLLDLALEKGRLDGNGCLQVRRINREKEKI